MNQPKPGRKLDALIAEKVFGAKIIRSAFHEGDPVISCDFPERKMGEMFPHLPNFSTEIQDAWLVVEEMQSNKWVFRIESPYCNRIPSLWRAYFGWKCVHDDDFDNYASESEIPAESICLAALAALDKK